MKHNLGRIAAALFAMVLIAPAAAAGWSGYADMYPEPNTKYDTSDRMFQEPNEAAVDKVYFNGMTGHLLLGPTPTFTEGDNPSVVQALHFSAIFGFWRDCNRDGFIGNALTGEHTYPVALLPNFDTCPTGSGYVNAQGDGWVTEFIHIGPGADLGQTEEPTGTGIGGSPDRTVNDTDALVWGDLGIPVQKPRPTAPIFPAAHGSLSSWEGHVNLIDQLTFGQVPDAVDEHGQGAVTYNDVYEVARTLDDAGVPSPIAAVKNLYNGSSGSDDEAEETPNCGGAGQPDCEGAYAQPLVSAWDCERPNGNGAVYLPTNVSAGEFGVDPETGDVTANPDPRVQDQYWFPPVAPNVNPDGSLDGTVYQFFRGFYATEDGCDNNPSIYPYGSAHVPYRNLERSAATGVGQPAKAETQLTFFFDEPTYAYENDGGDVDRTGFLDGIEYRRVGATPMAGWYSNQWFVRAPSVSNPATVLGDYRDPLAVTYFADATAAAFSQKGATASIALPSGNDAFRYGSEHCSAFNEEGVSDYNWNCDPEAWTTPAVVGDFYDLRDVDCVDGTMFGITTPRVEEAGMYDCKSDPRFA